VELDCALLPRSLQWLSLYNNDTMTTIRNLDQLTELRVLNLSWCSRLTTISAIPPSLVTLSLDHCDRLEALPPLVRSNLKVLAVAYTIDLDYLPALPESLQMLSARDSFFRNVPYFPPNLTYLELARSSMSRHFPHLAKRPGEDMATYTRRVLAEQAQRLRRERYDQIHEELMAATWHPRRVEAWSLAGEEVLDMMMGC
jgi:hypothetical protein